MANGNKFESNANTQSEETNKFENSSQQRGEYDVVSSGFGWPSIVKDPNVDGWKGYGIEVPDINFDFLKIEQGEDPTPEKLTAIESLGNSWNNLLDQLSLTDDRFYHLSEQLFGDTDSITFKEAQARINATEEAQQEAGGTLALEEIPDAFEQEGLIGGLAHTGAAVANATSAFVGSAIQAGLTGGGALAVDMVQGSVQDYTRQRAAELNISYEEAAQTLGSDVVIPIALGALSYKFEKFGLKGVGKAIKGLAPGAKKAIVSTLNASGKEGATEFAQGAVEAFNQGLGAKNSLDEAAENVGKFLEEDALETFLQGAVGGGISAAGGRAVRRVASTVRSKAAEQKIADSQEKILEVDAILNNPETTPEQKKILKRTRTALKNEIKKATLEPNKIVKKLSDENIAKINKKANDNRRLRDELSESRRELDDDAYYIVEENINDQLQDNADYINNILDDLPNKDVRLDDGSLSFNPTVESIFEGKQRGEISDSEAAVVAYEYENLARKTAKDLFRAYPEYGEQGYTQQDFVEDLQFGVPGRESESLIGLAKSFEPGKGSFGGYAQKYLKERGKGILQKQVGSQATTGAGELDEGSAGTTETEIKLKGPHQAKRLARRLGFSPETAAQFEEATEKTLRSKKLKTGTQQGFNKALTAAGREAIAGQIQKELGKKDDYFRNLVKNAAKYKKIIPAISLANSRGITQQWAENPPTDKEFIDYFRGLDQAANTRTDRKKSLAKFIADGIFAETAAEQLQDPDIQEAFALAQDFDANPKAVINSVNQARIALISKVPISEI